MAEFNGNLLEIYNGTGASLTYLGSTFAAGAYVPLGKMTQYKVGYKKLWSSDTGRSMTGENKGTLIGIFPKLEIKLGKMGDEDISAILRLTAQASADVRYYDAAARKVVTASFYFGDVDDEIRRQHGMRHAEISFSIIANKRRAVT